MNYESIPVFNDNESAESFYNGNDFIDILGYIDINDCCITIEDRSETKVEHPVFGECIIYHFEHVNHPEPYAITI